MFSFTRDELKVAAEELRRKREEFKKAEEAEAARIELEKQGKAYAERIEKQLKFSEKVIAGKLAALLIDSRPLVLKWAFSKNEPPAFRKEFYTTLGKELQSMGFPSILCGKIPDEIKIYASTEHLSGNTNRSVACCLIPMPLEIKLGETKK